MKLLMNYKQAQKLNEELENFINMVDDYKINNYKNWIIKHYAVLYSFSAVIKKAREESIQNEEGLPLTREDIVEVLREKKKDELHGIVKRMYKKKINRKIYN